MKEVNDGNNMEVTESEKSDSDVIDSKLEQQLDEAAKNQPWDTKEDGHFSLDQLHGKLAKESEEINEEENLNESIETEKGRTPIESEKKTEEMLDSECKDYTHQTILDENLHTLSKREVGSIAPDHMAAYDKDGNVIKGDDYSCASHFEIVEDKNYSIEDSSGRSNLVQNICKQAENRNEVLGVNGATIHQTYRIDVSGHEEVSVQKIDDLYNRLNNRLPDNVDVEFVLD